MMWKRLYICQRDIHYTPRCISLLYTLLWDLYAHERTIRCIYGYENSALLRRRVYFNFIMVVSSGTVKHESNRSPSAPRSSFTHHFAVLLLLPVDEYFGPLVSICVCDVCVHLTKINAFDYIRWCTMFRFQRFLFVFVFFFCSVFFPVVRLLSRPLYFIIHTMYTDLLWTEILRFAEIHQIKSHPIHRHAYPFYDILSEDIFFITQKHIKTVDNYSPLAWVRWKGLIIIRNETKDAQCINRDTVCFVECATLIFELVNNAFIWMTSKTWPSGHHRYVFSIGWQKPSSNNLSGWEMREKIACKQSPERTHDARTKKNHRQRQPQNFNVCVSVCNAI